MNASNGNPGDGSSTGEAAPVQALLAAFDETVRESHVQERFGDAGRAFSNVLGTWTEPFAAAMREFEPSAHSRAAAHAMADLARLTGTFARDTAQQLASAASDSPDPASGECQSVLAARIDDAFRAFSSSPEFDSARRHAAATVMDWLERDPASARALARALETPPAKAGPLARPWADEPRAAMLDANATLIRYAGERTARASLLLVPGFMVDPDIFDIDPQRSVVRTLVAHGVDTWRLDWGRPDETGDRPTVADRIDRIDRAVDTVREATDGRRPALAGHFHGGLLALLYCIRRPDKVGALVTLSTPVEFASGSDALADWLRACNAERLADLFGDVPGAVSAFLMAAASPMQSCGAGLFTLLEGIDTTSGAARAARVERARRFPPAFPGETFRGLYRTFYRDNAFVAEGGAVFDGHRYEPASLATPLLNVFGIHDRIVPPGASAPLAELAQVAFATTREHRGGHFDLITGHRTHTELLPDVAAWLIEHNSRS